MCDSDSEAFESADEDIAAVNMDEKTLNQEKVHEKKGIDGVKPIVKGLETKEIAADQQPDEQVVVKEQIQVETEKGWDFDDWEIEDKVTSEYIDSMPPVLKEISGPKVVVVLDADDVEAKLKETCIKEKGTPAATRSISSTSKETESNQSTWGWRTPSWGGAAVSFLTTASKSVASITTNITQVIESGMGVPNPETLARLQAEEELKLKQDGYIKEDDEPTQEAHNQQNFPFGNIVSGVTQISSKVISGGLDTLEGIGKKTMTILQENDPGLLNKRKLLGMENEAPILSQVLREAKEKTEEREKNLKQIHKHLYKKKLHFETLFDDYQGLVHLEALEMLSRQASLKLESLLGPLTGNALKDLEETLNEVKELCELNDTENDDTDGTHSVGELEAKLKDAVQDLDEIHIDFSEISGCWESNLKWLEERKCTNSKEIYEKALHGLAQTTALCVQRMHKLAENLLILDHHSTANEADSLVQLATIFCWHLSGMASKFSGVLSNIDNDGDNNTLITNIFLESSNSTSYIQNAFQLFIPILQIGAA